MNGDKVQSFICSFDYTDLLHKYSRPLISQFTIVIPLPAISWLNS